ncbi:MAG: hypothetical protein ACMG5Z_06180 [Luteimonas sp.]
MPAHAEEEAEREALAAVGRQHYLAGDYAGLDAIIDGYRKGSERTSSGLWKSGLVENGVEDATARPATQEEWLAAEAHARRWIEANPASVFAPINLAHVIAAHAWSIRGGDYAYKVPKQAWKPFGEELARARKVLDKAKRVSSADPEWYDQAIDIATADGRERKEVDALFNEAVAREPGYYPAYFAMVRYLLPKWNGDLHEIEAFANRAVALTRASEGGSMYARIYWFASQVEFDNGLFLSSFARWDRVDAGFQDVLARYPDQWNLNHYAKFACLAADPKRTRELMQRIDVPIRAAWEPDGLFERCQRSAGILAL